VFYLVFVNVFILKSKNAAKVYNNLTFICIRMCAERTAQNVCVSEKRTIIRTTYVT